MRSKLSPLFWFVLLASISGLLLGCGSSSSSPDDGAGGSAGDGVGKGGGDGGGGGSGKGGTGGTCTPRTCEDEGAECGWIFDGCGEILDCGGCADGQTCGFHEANRCGSCPAATCDSLSVDGKKACGQHDDGCGNVLECGGCPDGEVCGDGTENVCVGSKDGGDIGVVCRDREEACLLAGIECGTAPDGCGGLVDCGGCTVEGDTCGGSGIPGVCGQEPPCEPRTCEQLGFECGLAVDNCGQIIDCGPVDVCGPDEVCGGGGANRCGKGGSGNEAECSDGEMTVLRGTVRTPRGAQGDPLYGALVYIPKSEQDIPLFPPGLTCDRCEDQVPPTAVAYAITGPDGRFVLTDVPSGQQSLVIQLGKWRRKVDIDIEPCEENVLSAEQTRLPRRHNEGNVYDHIPRIAVSTGRVDALECVLRKMGVDDSEFSNPDGDGRIHFYKGSHSAGAVYNSNTPSESELVGDLNRLRQYDAVLLACQASETSRKEEDVYRLVDYTNEGGRIFATHFSRDWLRYYEPFQSTANWSGNNNGLNSATGRVDQSFQKGRDFAEWLQEVGAGNQSGQNVQLTIYEARQSINSVTDHSQRWIYLPNNNNYVQHMTFNTPVGSPVAQQCGRVVFSDFHVTTGTHNGKTFPSQCGGSMNLSAQEKVLAFMLFDLASCIQEDEPPPPTCTPRSCEDLSRECGMVGDGCGDVLNCGSCPGDLTCGGGGTPGQCGKPTCEPLTCEDVNVQCGPAGDGCGGILDCGTCPAGMLCGVGEPGVCGTPTCTPKTCEQLGVACGKVGDGCGGQLDCGCCPGTCGDEPQ